ncbi:MULTISPECIES: hypothetical protein [unclassified Providencia]|uniref:hypothetical protein n=1 Tax=unclassified Providencia TaxID=2633465 RepID=UPI0023493044|nr:MULTISPECIES: hypothetical protein [unclassified Providencia]
MSIEQSKQNENQTQLNWWFITIGSIVPIMIPFIKYFREQAKITPDSLDKQNLFLIAIFAPIVYFFLLGYVAWDGTEIDRSWNGFNKFLEISKLPLGILALSPIFGVFVSNVHRTIQTAKQISTAERQIAVAEVKNISDSFYSHNKYIIDEFSSLSFRVKILNEDVNIKSPNKLYKKVFKKSSIKKGMNDEVDVNYLSVTGDNLGLLKSSIKNIMKSINENEFIFNDKLNSELIKLMSEIRKIIGIIVRQNELNDSLLIITKEKINEKIDLTAQEIKSIENKNETSMHREIENAYTILAIEIITFTIISADSILDVYSRIFDIINADLPNEFFETRDILVTNMGEVLSGIKR